MSKTSSEFKREEAILKLKAKQKDIETQHKAKLKRQKTRLANGNRTKFVDLNDIEELEGIKKGDADDQDKSLAEQSTKDESNISAFGTFVSSLFVACGTTRAAGCCTTKPKSSI